MKFLTILFMISTLSASCRSNIDKFSGDFVGFNIGLSKVGYDKSTSVDGVMFPYVQQKKPGLHGSIFHTSRIVLEKNILAGYFIDYSLEDIERKEISRSLTIEAHRCHIFNILGTLGYNASSNVMPYIIGGVSLAKFKLKIDSPKEKHTRRPSVLGFSIGTGLDYLASKNTIINMQYLYTNYNEAKNDYFTSKSTVWSIYTPETYHTLTLGFKFRI